MGGYGMEKHFKVFQKASKKKHKDYEDISFKI